MERALARVVFRGVMVVLLCSACGLDHLTPIEPEVDLQPASLDFGVVAVGEAVRREVTITNRSNASVEIGLEAGTPFTIAETRVTLAGGESLAVTVEVIALTSGRIERTLTVTPGGSVELRADAQSCGAPAPCETFALACTRVTKPDGTACSAPCVSASTCLAGQCVGAPVDCDDHDACTSDACGADGCAHAPIACEALVDPCKAARCDPARGCVADPLADGTSCGDNDCTTAHVCITGQCVARAAPEGSTCAPASGCRQPSRCQAGACVAGPTSTLFPVWTFEVEGLGRQGLRVGDDGNLYFLERTRAPITHWLVSLDAQGGLRFRISSSFSAIDAPLVLVSSGVVVLASTTHRVGDPMLLEAYAMTDGALLWSTTHAGLFPVAQSPFCTSVPSTWIGADGAGRLMVRASMFSGCEDVGVGFAVLDVRTGAVISRRQSRPWSPTSTVRSAVIDASGRWVFVEPDGSRLAAWTNNLVEAWNTTPRTAPIAATPGGRLIGGDGVVLLPMGTAVAGSTLTTSWPGGGALTGTLERAFFLSQANGAEQVEKFDLTSSQALWQHRVVASATGASTGFLGILTARDSVVFSSRNVLTSDTDLVEVSWEGDELTRCPLRSGPVTRILAIGQAALLQDRWVTYDALQSRVTAYDLDGLRPAEHGWVTPGGTQGAEMRPR